VDSSFQLHISSKRKEQIPEKEFALKEKTISHVFCHSDTLEVIADIQRTDNKRGRAVTDSAILCNDA
jgi:hypothetical protein